MDETENILVEHCVYAMWRLEKTDPTVYRYIRDDGAYIPLGNLQDLANTIVAKVLAKRKLSAVEERILVCAIEERLHD